MGPYGIDKLIIEKFQKSNTNNFQVNHGIYENTNGLH